MNADQGVKPVWIAVGINPLTEKVLLVGVAKDREAAVSKFARVDDDVCYRRVLLIDDSLGKTLFDWLRSCGIAHGEAANLVREFGRKMLSMFKSPKRRKRR